MAELSFAAGLFDIFTFSLSFSLNGFFIGNLRLADRNIYLKFPFHSVDDNFQMKFAHAGNNHFARFLVALHFKSRVFFA